MKIWFDCEFIDDGRTIDLLSIGMVREDGQMFYATTGDRRVLERAQANSWLQEHVMPQLCDLALVPQLACTADLGVPRDIMAAWIRSFAGDNPEFWAYYGAYDWVCLCQLFGPMINLPKGWPMYARDLKQLVDMLGNPRLPKQLTAEHHAINDAMLVKEAWHWAFAEWERQNGESPTL